MLLSGKTAIVTGAARGFGFGIAQALIREGCSVAVTDIDSEELKRAEVELKKCDGNFFCAKLDVSDLAQWQKLVAEMVERYGRLDAVIQNAVFMPLTLFSDLSVEDWYAQINVSIGGMYNAAKSAWDQMLKQHFGHVIYVASGSSARGYRYEVPYCAAKHAQEGFIKSMALETDGLGIGFNSIGPGAKIKPTRMTWQEWDSLPSEEKNQFNDPAELGRAFVWMILQDPQTYCGHRFDAGTLSKTIAAEGYDFEFSPEKATLYVQEFQARKHHKDTYVDEFPQAKAVG